METKMKAPEPVVGPDTRKANASEKTEAQIAQERAVKAVHDDLVALAKHDPKGIEKHVRTLSAIEKDAAAYAAAMHISKMAEGNPAYADVLFKTRPDIFKAYGSESAFKAAESRGKVDSLFAQKGISVNHNAHIDPEQKGVSLNSYERGRQAGTGSAQVTPIRTNQATTTAAASSRQKTDEASSAAKRTRSRGM